MIVVGKQAIGNDRDGEALAIFLDSAQSKEIALFVRKNGLLARPTIVYVVIVSWEPSNGLLAWVRHRENPPR